MTRRRGLKKQYPAQRGVANEWGGYLNLLSVRSGTSQNGKGVGDSEFGMAGRAFPSHLRRPTADIARDLHSRYVEIFTPKTLEKCND